MDELEKLQAQLAEANDKIAKAEAEKVQALADAETARAAAILSAKTEEDLRRELAARDMRQRSRLSYPRARWLRQLWKPV